MKTDSTFRIAITFVMLVTCVILYTGLTGYLPDERVYRADQRANISEVLATGIAFQLTRHHLEDVGSQMEFFANQNDDLVSCGIRRHDGTLVVEVGEHAATWARAKEQRNDGCYVVPLIRGTEQWGSLELQFSPQYVGFERFLSKSQFVLLGIVTSLTGLGAWLQLRRLLRFFDPERAVPPRVQEALDNFAEGVVVLNENDEIVLANETFARFLDVSSHDLVGKPFWNLAWTFAEEQPVRESSKLKNTRMHLADKTGNIRAIFSVNASPVVADDGECHGNMLAFNDITPLERNRAALLSTLEDLSRSKKEIAEQNEELKYLATRDPLTSCVNRRTFFQEFENFWEMATTGKIRLSVIMVDIDFFKSINDNYGHSMGDEVLQAVGKLLNEAAGECHVASRYGGEEFSILLRDFDITQGTEFAEQLRISISKLRFSIDLSITASLGVSSFSLEGKDPQDMLDQADRCLYVAKRNGRNQVVRFDDVPDGLVVDESKISREKPAEEIHDQPTIPYRAVSALVSALSYRDPMTGAHSVRVANLAGALAQRVTNPQEAYIIEMASLLHDIGKVGVPDSILLKPGPLTDEEWKVMQRHDQIGIEIINKSFQHQGLTNIVKCHHYHFDGSANQQSSSHESIPLGARILSIVDAFDAMISDRPYRKSVSIAHAINELRRCRGQQFDPVLVDQFIALIESGLLNQELEVDVRGDATLVIGEQLERIVRVVEDGDTQSFIALTQRMGKFAEANNIPAIVDAAQSAVAWASEHDQLEAIGTEVFQLLAACRAARTQMAEVSSENA
ncbi:MAG: diguanylate cyclase [Planctomycetales bacterium]|nr:diguanylate cyclase [Planctomycetales bacterium]